ncbi:sulfate adenylyltransferase [Streptomyces bryophytorum]|nr:sulfate adenylyltransferase [Actinacidiphila bryophytorum]MBN6542873.1 sulfate adenylyltransferase [Actinacidiphila bryophytorum]
MGLLTMAQDAFSGFAKEGGRVGSGSLGSGTGGVARCVR